MVAIMVVKLMCKVKQPVLTAVCRIYEGAIFVKAYSWLPALWAVSAQAGPLTPHGVAEPCIYPGVTRAHGDNAVQGGSINSTAVHAGHDRLERALTGNRRGHRIGPGASLIPEGVIAKRQQTPSERDPGDVAPAQVIVHDPNEELAVGCVPRRPGRGFHHRPANQARPRFGDMPAMDVTGAGAFDRGQPGPGAETLGAGEPQPPHARVILEQPPQLAVKPFNLERQFIDHLQIGLDAGAGQLGQRQLLKELHLAFEPRAEADQSRSGADETSRFPRRRRTDPGLRQQVGA